MTKGAGEAAIKELFEVAPLGIALVDSTRRFVWVNDSLCKFLGYSRSEFLKLSVNDISKPDERDEETRERFIRGEISQVTLEKRQITKRGDTKWVRVNACVFRPGSKEGEYGALFVEDISDRVRIERDLADRSSGASELLSTLTSRERELLQLLAAGNTFTQIAEALYISKRTVESHAASAYRKLGVKGREEATRKLEELLRLVDIRWTLSATGLGITQPEAR